LLIDPEKAILFLLPDAFFHYPLLAFNYKIASLTHILFVLFPHSAILFRLYKNDTSMCPILIWTSTS